MSTRRKRGCKPLFFPPPPDVPPGGGYVVASFGPWVQGPGPGPGGPLSPAPHPSQRPGAEAGTLKGMLAWSRRGTRRAGVCCG